MTLAATAEGGEKNGNGRAAATDQQAGVHIANHIKVQGVQGLYAVQNKKANTAGKRAGEDLVLEK
jgi:hypothetical protein